MANVLSTARAYHAAGLGVIPIRPDGSKAPALPRGHPYLYQRPTEKDLHRWFAAGRSGIAIACGAVSGHLETLDFETLAIYRNWRDQVETKAPGLTDRLCWVLTPGHLGSRGMHGRYRCPDAPIPGSMALAYELYADESPPQRHPFALHPKRRLLIETRGEGSYAIAPGSPAACHQTGRQWEHVAGPDLLHLPNLTPPERELLIASARALNRCPTCPVPFAGSLQLYPNHGFLPGDDFNAGGPDWSAILEPHGWELVRTSGNVRYWRRPGKHSGSWSATTGYCRASDGSDLLHVFSSNASPFEPQRSYSKFRAYTLLEHWGDYRAAARELGRQGFGKPRRHAQIFTGSSRLLAGGEQ